MEKTQMGTGLDGRTKNPLSYALMAIGILLLGLGVPVLFATSQVSRLIGDSLGQGPILAILGLLIVASGATMLAIGLRQR